jgi:predicted DNA binding CopG/RHH family protein
VHLRVSIVDTSAAAIRPRTAIPSFARSSPATTAPAPEGTAKYQAVSLRLSPEALTWAKKEAERRGIGYQTVINETLLKASA